TGTTVAESTGSSGTISAWGPQAGPCGGLSGLAGGEAVYMLAANGTTPVTVGLKSRSPGKNVSLLVLDEGPSSMTSCSPTAACASSTALAGTGLTGSYTTDQAAGKTVSLTFPRV